jgi:tetratricopeptide (TPR) repeat protein
MQLAFSRTVLIRLALSVCAFAAGLWTEARADTVSVNTAGGYARLLFTFTPKAHVNAKVDGGVLTLSFDRKTDVSAAALTQDMSAFAGGGRVDANGRTYRFALAQPMRIHQSASANQIAVDLIPDSFTGVPPDLPPPPPPPPKTVDVSTLPMIAVRSGAYQNFTRLVFDWPHDVKYAVFPGAGKLGIRFEALARVDVSSIARFAPPWVKNASWRVENQGTIVEFDTDQASGFHDFRDGSKVVIDVLAPRTDADTYHPPGGGKATITALTPVAGKTSAVSAAQAAEIAATAQRLANANAPPAPPTTPPAPAAAAPPPSAATPPPPADATAAPVQDADGQLTRNGAILTFAGAANRGSAVFMRGLTAWIVLQGAAPLDAVKLKNSLGTFPVAVEAASANGVSELRITFAQPEQIGAHADGSNLKVVIGSQVDETPIAIGFSRNQDDATHSSLSTLLPGATHPVTLTDPVAGDQLVLVPAAAGRAMLGPHDYVEFGVLKTASGLALAPYIDDLSVSIDRTRVTITHPGGLALTPPTMPVADSPAAIAARGGSPSFLDFASWGKFTGGSFLNTERRLRAATARLKPVDAQHARLVLARFYLANGFSAEAIGLVNLMQQQDPALQSDRQLQTIRAAAEYEMGRYRDAHNDLSGAAFDADRHAAYWRGLIEAAQEDWDNARADLDRAEPVLNQYQPDWQARQRIAKAQAALGQGHLEVADAAIARLPANIAPDLQTEANVVRARLLAAENRGHEAGLLFDTVEKSGDAQAAAESIYYRTDAALKAGVMTSDAAIATLERLRFRWRGDLLEMKTLRKLASLYFAKQRWRDGLHTLRIAAAAFPNDDISRKAQDDMRAAFHDLFIGGKADKIQPIEALAIFYDFIDLTPIGPDGDEMIRRMSERLVAQDLLDPAADLLSYQIDKRLDGVARAQVATRLAMIYLMDQKPQKALDTIRTTQISTLPISACSWRRAPSRR